MKARLTNLLLILTTLPVYLEWGGGNKMFLWQGERDIIQKLFSSPEAAMHPLILIPLAGQILLAITLFQEYPSRRLTQLGIACIGMLLLFIFCIGIFSRNFKIACSVLPFIITAALTLIHHRKTRKRTIQAA